MACISCLLAELPTGPWAVDIYDEDEFYTSLAGLIIKHPNVRTWLFKIDDERDSRGHAYLDLGKIRDLGDSLRSCVQEMGGAGGKGSSSASSMPGSGVSRYGTDAEPAMVGADANEIQMLLQRHCPKKVTLCNRRVYPDFAAWMSEVCRVGAVIQAVPDNLISQTSVHVQIDPDGGTSVLGSSEALMSQSFVRAASWFPHTQGSWEVLHETGMRMGRVLAAKGLVGFASVDVVFFKNPDFDPALAAEDDREPTPAVIGTDTPVDPQHLMFGGLRSPSPAMSTSSTGGDGRNHSMQQVPPSLPESRQADYELAIQLQELQPQRRARDPVSMMLPSPPQATASPISQYACWIVDVDARLTDEAAALFPLQFVAQVQPDMATGLFRLTGEAPAAENAEQMSEEERYEKSCRWSLISHVAQSPGLDKMSYQSLFQAAKMRGISFDLFHNIGCVFTFLDVFHSLFTLLCVEKTPENCAKRLTAAVGALAEGQPGKNGQTGARTNTKIAAPRDAPLPPGQEMAGGDTISVTDVQMALRTALRRWPERH